MAKEKTKPFVLRLDSATMAAVEKWAADEFRSTNGQLQWIVNEALRKADEANAELMGKMTGGLGGFPF